MTDLHRQIRCDLLSRSLTAQSAVKERDKMRKGPAALVPFLILICPYGLLKFSR